MYFNVGSKKNRGLRKYEVTLRVGNGTRVDTLAMGTYPLWLLSDFSLILRNYYYVPTASRNSISILILAQDGYIFNFDKDYYLIYFENKLITHSFMIDGLYHLHMDAFMNISK